MQRHHPPVDIAMIGTFAAWRLGTMQARALPIARRLQQQGIRCAIVTTPWDMPDEAGVVDSISGVALHNTSSIGVRSPIPAIRQQERLIRALRPSLVQVFKPKGFGGFAGHLLSSRLPDVIDSDDWEGDGGWNQAGGYSRLQQRVFNWQEQSLLRRAQGVSAASQLLARRAIALRDDADSTVEWVPNGLDPHWTSRLTAARNHLPGAESAHPTIVLYSRFAEFPADWLPRFINALSTSVPDHVVPKIRVVGETQTLGFGFSGIVLEQVGYVALDRIPQLLGSSDVAIYPYADSLISRSKNSVKLLELMASGCAIVASAIGDIPAVIGDGGLLVGSAEPELFAARTSDLLGDPLTMRRLASSAQNRVKRLFTIDVTTSRLVSLFGRIGALPR